MAVRLLVTRCLAGASHAGIRRVTAPAAAVSAKQMVGVQSSQVRRFSKESKQEVDELFDAQDEKKLLHPDAPWYPIVTAEDYDNCILLLLNSHKVEFALELLERQFKRGFRPSVEVIDTIHEIAKLKPEWQQATVKSVNSLDFSAPIRTTPWTNQPGHEYNN